MKEFIEKAIMSYLCRNGWQILVDGKIVTIPKNSPVNYIRSYTCPPYNENEQDKAIEWEQEYKVWKTTDHFSLIAIIQFSIGTTKMESTTFDFQFVDDENMRIVINELTCTEKLSLETKKCK